MGLGQSGNEHTRKTKRKSARFHQARGSAHPVAVMASCMSGAMPQVQMAGHIATALKSIMQCKCNVCKMYLQ